MHQAPTVSTISKAMTTLSLYSGLPYHPSCLITICVSPITLVYPPN